MNEEQLNKIRMALRKDAQDKQILEKEIPAAYAQNLSPNIIQDVANAAINIDLKNQNNLSKDVLMEQAAKQLMSNPSFVPSPDLMQSADNDSFKNILNRVYLQGLQKQRGSK